MKTQRGWLKSDRWDVWAKIDTDQKKKIPPPPLQLPCPEDARKIDLVAPENFTVGGMPLIQALCSRKSRRQFTPEALSLEELSFLLWATQGVREVLQDGLVTRRTVPSGGSRHPFETYLVINRVEGVTAGLYRYLPLTHQLCRIETLENPLARIPDERYKDFVRLPAAIFVWTVIPYRTEWRYSVISDKIIALDAGHVCQNLYLACEALGLGTCAYDGYDQNTVDAMLNVDGEEEFTIYLSTVGRIKPEQ